MTLLLQSEAAIAAYEGTRSTDRLLIERLRIIAETAYRAFEIDWLRKAERRLAEEARVGAMEGIDV